MMKIHYIGAYADTERLSSYYLAPSGSAKMEYIKDVIKSLDISVSIFSPICTKNKGYTKAASVVVDDNESVYYPASFGKSSKFKLYLSYTFIYCQLFFYFLSKVKRGDKVLVYHSLPDTQIIKIFNLFFGYELFLELEELYSAVFQNYNKIEKEKRIINNGFSGYVLVNSIIANKCSIDKPSVICEGQYKMLTKEPRNIRDCNNVINLLYAGVLQKDSDVFLSIETACHLDSSFCLHVAGYGDEGVVKEIEEIIDKHNSKNNRCKIVFHGCLYGAEYEDLLNSCSVGLCTRMLKDDLSDYTFPSKIYAYLTRNLKVICTPITCVQKSTISKSIVFSTDTSAEEITKVIKGITSEYTIDNTIYVEAENIRFKEELANLLIN